MLEALKLKGLKASDLGASLEANNVTFNVGFLVVFVYTRQVGLVAWWMPFAFVIGIVLYAYLWLPRHVQILKHTGNLPEYLSSGPEHTQTQPSPALRRSITFFLLQNYLAYGMLEVQGFRWFSQATVKSAWISEALVIGMLIGMVIYLWRLALQGKIRSDRWLLGFIYAGVAVLWILGLKILWQQPVLPNQPRITDLFSAPVFSLQMLFGFACSQLLYAENWLRIHAWLQQPEVKSKLEKNQQQTLAELRQAFLRAAAGNLFVLSTPVLLGLLAFSNTELDPANAFAGVLQLLSGNQLWQIPFFILILLMALAAIISTLNTFALTSAVLLNLSDQSWRWGILGFITCCYLCSFLPFDLTSAYIFVSFLLNLLVGPILWRFYRQKPLSKNHWYVCLFGGLSLTLISLAMGLMEWLGIILLGFTLLTFVSQKLPAQLDKTLSWTIKTLFRHTNRR